MSVKKIPADYIYNVFINCPFDPEYNTLFNALLFTIYTCGFTPRCALEVNDSGELRFDKIVRIIRSCQLGIHDISRTEMDKSTHLPRFNMPLELGLFLGSKIFSNGYQKAKKILIVDRDQHRYHSFISDISGQDIHAHNNDPECMIQRIRDFLNASQTYDRIEGTVSIRKGYKEFEANLPALCNEYSLDINTISYTDKTQLIEKWISLHF